LSGAGVVRIEETVSQKTKDMTGVLLAGGKSLRMGSDKRFLDLGGRTLLDRSLSVLERLFPEAIVSVAEPVPQLAGLRHRVVADLIPGAATLGGLYSGLSCATRTRVFAAACDMPLLNASVIERLAQGLQPMHAVYSKACLPVLEQMIRGKNFRLQDLVQAPGLSVRILTEDDVRDLDPQFLSFLNVNTPADLEFSRKLLAARERDRPGDEK
jgi:molybdopterin-guanine dinucleotide biosynthesis protein A